MTPFRSIPTPRDWVRAIRATASAIAISSACVAAAPSAFAADNAASAEQSASTAPEAGKASTQPSTSGPAGLADIIVTARKSEENIQKVPLNISAFTTEDLQRKDIRDLQALVRSVPGVNLCCNYNAALVFVRGILNGSPSYFADVPVPTGGFGSFFDVSSVQVLKGPQGTLFGQASNGGAFVYQPRKPGKELGGSVEVSGGSLNRRTLEAELDVPINDRIHTRIAGITFARDGYITDISNGKKYGDLNYYVVRPSISIDITDNLNNYTLYQFSHSQDSGNTSAYVLHDFNFFPDSMVPANAAAAGRNGGSRAAYDALREQLLLQQRALGPYQTIGFSVGCATVNGPIYGPTSVTSLNYPRVACPGNYANTNILANHTTWKFADGWQLKNIFGRTWGNTFAQPGDTDTTILIINDNGSPRNINPVPIDTVWSDEIQLQGKLGQVDLTLGTFLTGRHNTPMTIFGLTNNTPSATISTTSSSSRAVFGQIKADLSNVTEGLSAAFGARYTWDKVNSMTQALNPDTLAVIRTVGGPTSPAGHAQFHNLSYMASVQYQMTPRTMFYVTNSRGYSSGGLQNAVGFETFAPDVLTNLEGGVKSTFNLGGMTVRANAEYYYGWFNNIKVFVYRPVTNSATGITSAVGITQNAAKATISGFDGDLTLVVNRRLQLGGFLSYLNAKYTSWQSVDPVTLAPLDLSDTTFLLSPKWKFGVNASYNIPLSGLGDLTFKGSLVRRSTLVTNSQPLKPTNPANPNTGLICYRDRTTANYYPTSLADGKREYIDCRPPQTMVDAGIDWNNFLGHDRLTLGLSVNNVFDTTRTDQTYAGDHTYGYQAEGVAPPRTWYLRMRYEY